MSFTPLSSKPASKGLLNTLYHHPTYRLDDSLIHAPTLPVVTTL
ncbi:hypothetical protein PALI_a0005 [Pseudoalteromonas aliena SW19]|uniref:Uncharacterized protein n=1 Tax=Pseudoalteromonas aliena SW19 TaxID=1314866 RepID=A0ABR9DWV3_9GAMM|nr:hypothetical protein [Pseudoalteromonas aliena SW19]